MPTARFYVSSVGVSGYDASGNPGTWSRNPATVAANIGQSPGVNTDLDAGSISGGSIPGITCGAFGCWLQGRCDFYMYFSVTAVPNSVVTGGRLVTNITSANTGTDGISFGKSGHANNVVLLDNTGYPDEIVPIRYPSIGVTSMEFGSNGLGTNAYASTFAASGGIPTWNDIIGAYAVWSNLWDGSTMDSIQMAYIEVDYTVNNPPVYTSAATNTAQTVARTTGTVTALATTDPENDPRTYALQSGSLPPGVTLNTDGTFTGSPTTAGTYTSTIRATSTGGFADTTLVITVPAGTPRVTATKTRTSATPVAAGNQVTWSLVVKNDTTAAGCVGQNAVTVSDPIPANISARSWTRTKTGTGTVTGGAASGTGAINESLTLDCDVTLTYTITDTVNSATPASTTITQAPTITAPSGNPAGTSLTPTATVTTLPPATPRITATKTRTSAAVGTPGSTVTWSLVVKNDTTAAGCTVGGSQATVNDPLPTNVSARTWTAANTGTGAVTGGAASGTGAINETVTMDCDTTRTYTITDTIAATTPGDTTITQAPTITAPAGNPAGTSLTPTATVKTPAPRITLTDTRTSAAQVAAGGTVTWQIVVANGAAAAGCDGPSPSTLTAAIPANVSGRTWTRAVSGTVTGGAASGSGAINETITLDCGATATYTVTDTVAAATPPSTTITQNASATAPAGNPGGSPVTGSATVQTLPPAVPRITATKTRTSAATAAPGSTVTWSLVVKNDTLANGCVAGGSNATINDPLPTNISARTWTAVNSGTGAITGGAATGTGAMNETVTMECDSTRTYTITDTVASSAPLSTVITQSPTVTAPAGNPAGTSLTPTATVTTVDPFSCDLTLTKTTPTTSLTAGKSIVYTLTLTNNGPDVATGVTLNDPMPATAGTTRTWTRTVTGGATSVGGPSGTGAYSVVHDLPVGAQVVVTITDTVPLTATGNHINNATVVLPSNIVDPSPVGTVTVTTPIVPPVADLTLTKTGPVQITAGTNAVWTVTLENLGPEPINGVKLDDPIPPANVTTRTWSSVLTGGATAPVTSGTGAYTQLHNLPVGGKVVITVTDVVPIGSTGNVVQTVTPTVPAGYSDPTPIAPVTLTVPINAPQSDLILTKTGPATITAGGQAVWTVVLENTGPTAIPSGVTLADPVPGNVSARTWSAALSGGATIVGSLTGSGAYNRSHGLPVGGKVTLTITDDVALTATGNVVQVATATLPPGYVDPTPPAPASVTAPIVPPVADVVMTKTGPASVTAGSTATYAVTVTNNGPTPIPIATGVVFTDPLVAPVTARTWTRSVTNGASGSGASTGSGAINQTLALPVGGSVTFNVVDTVPIGTTGTVSNSATATVNPLYSTPTPPGTVTATVPVNAPVADVTLTKTGPASVVAGQTCTYTVVVKNTGPNAIPLTTPVVFDDPVVAPVTTRTWTRVMSGGATGSGSSSGTGAISQNLGLPVNGSVTYTVVDTIPLGTSGTVSNSATATMPPEYADTTPPGTVTATVPVTTPVAKIDVTKTTTAAAATAGQTIVTVGTWKNSGSTAVANNGVLITDPVPANVVSRTYTAVASAGVTGFTSPGTGGIVDNVTMPIGTQIVYTITDTLDPTSTGLQYTQVARAELDPDYVDPRGPQTATIDMPITAAKTDVVITKTGASTALTGQPFKHIVTVTNTGPFPLTGYAFEDPLPVYDGISAAYTSISSGGATGATVSGNGGISDVLNLPVNGKVTYTITYSSIVGTTPDGVFTNVASGTLPEGYADPTPAGASLSTTIAGPRTDIVMTKTGPAQVLAGSPITWVLKVRNNGPQAVSALAIEDPIPLGQGVLSWAYTATASGGVTGVTASGVAGISDTVNMPVGGQITYTITAQTDPLYVGAIGNAATVTLPPGFVDPTPITSPVEHTVQALAPQADIRLQKTASKTVVYPGDPIVFNIVVLNRGPQPVANLLVNDPLPDGLTNVTWTASFAGGATGTFNGSGAINELVTIPVNGQIRYTVNATAGPTTVPTTITNTLNVELPPGTEDPNGGLTVAATVNHLPPYADITASKVANTGSIYPFGTVVHTLKVKNNGILRVDGYQVEDPVDTDFVLSRTWTATVTGGVRLPATSGTGLISQTFDFPVGGEVTYTITERIKPSANPGLYRNKATLTLPAGIDDPTPVPEVSDQVQVLSAVALSCVSLKMRIRAMCCGEDPPAGSYMTVKMIQPQGRAVYDPLSRPPALVDCTKTSTSAFIVDPTDPDFWVAETCPLTPTEGFTEDVFYRVTVNIGGTQCDTPYDVRIPIGTTSPVPLLDMTFNK